MQRPNRRSYLAVALSAAIAIGLALATGSAAAAHGTDVRRCGDILTKGAFVGEIRAQGVSCRSARRVTRRWVHADHTQDPVRVGRWRCRFRATGHESGRVRCLRAGDRSKVVRFVTSA